jgi:hypothetical protein
MPTDKWIDQLIALRTAVGLIGEEADPSWWKSQAMNANGISFLEHIFPRTAHSAAAQLGWRAAQREHDRRIGAIGAYHLYRLPSAVEDVITNRFLTARPEDVPDRQTAIQLLEDVAGEQESGGEAQSGPVSCGKFAATDRAFAMMAMHYLAGVTNSRPVFPYFISQ